MRIAAHVHQWREAEAMAAGDAGGGASVVPLDAIRALCRRRLEVEHAAYLRCGGGVAAAAPASRLSVGRVVRTLLGSSALLHSAAAPPSVVPSPSVAEGAAVGRGALGVHRLLAPRANEEEEEPSMCVICHRGFNAGQVAAVLPCRHTFHL